MLVKMYKLNFQCCYFSRFSSLSRMIARHDHNIIDWAFVVRYLDSNNTGTCTCSIQNFKTLAGLCR